MKKMLPRQRIINSLIICAGVIGILFIILSATGVIEQKSLEFYYNLQEDSEKLSGNGTMDDPYLIRNLQEYKLFANLVNSGTTFEGDYISLMSNINLKSCSEEICIGIADSDNKFLGTFLGNGYTIKGLSVNRPEGEVGLFVNLGGTVCNLNVSDCSLQGNVVGGIASSLAESGKIINCCVKDTKVTGNVAGALVGNSFGLESNCLIRQSGNLVGDQILGSMEYIFQGNIRTFSYINGEETGIENAVGMVKILNNQIGNLNGKYKIPTWNQWKKGIIYSDLSKNQANVVNQAKLQIMVDGEKRNIKGFYSSEENSWCFAIPAELYPSDRKLIIEIQGQPEQKMKIAQDTTEWNYDYMGISYQFKIKINDTIPSLFIDTYASNGFDLIQSEKEKKLQGDLKILNSDGKMEYEGRLNTVKSRGNDSWKVDKKGYAIELTEPADLLEMGKNNDFILISGYRDNSLLSYKLIEDLSKEIGIDYAPESRLVNLYMDNQYRGVYFITEKIEIDENRFELKNSENEIKALNKEKLSDYPVIHWKDSDSLALRTYREIPNIPKDITGGYILELNSKDYSEDQSRFQTERGSSFVLKSNTSAAKEQVDYIADFWQEFEDALFSEDGYNNQGKYYAEYIDLESFADQWIIYEMNKETSMAGSIYYYKDSDETGDGLIHASYLWDAEHSFKYKESDITISWIRNHMVKIFNEFHCEYWVALYQHEDFAKMVEKEWNEKYLPALDIILSKREIDNEDGVGSLAWYAKEYEEANQINDWRWPSMNWQDKCEKIRYFLENRKDFLSVVFSSYSLGYDYINEVDGDFYGYYYLEDGTVDEEAVGTKIDISAINN